MLNIIYLQNMLKLYIINYIFCLHEVNSKKILNKIKNKINNAKYFVIMASYVIFATQNIN